MHAQNMLISLFGVAGECPSVSPILESLLNFFAVCMCMSPWNVFEIDAEIHISNQKNPGIVQQIRPEENQPALLTGCGWALERGQPKTAPCRHRHFTLKLIFFRSFRICYSIFVDAPAQHVCIRTDIHRWRHICATCMRIHRTTYECWQISSSFISERCSWDAKGQTLLRKRLLRVILFVQIELWANYPPATLSFYYFSLTQSFSLPAHLTSTRTSTISRLHIKVRLTHSTSDFNATMRSISSSCMSSRTSASGVQEISSRLVVRVNHLHTWVTISKGLKPTSSDFVVRT